MLAEGDNPWHHFLFYREGERIARIRCREFASEQGKRAAFSTAALLIPVVGADEVMWMANVTLTMIKVDAREIDPRDL